MYKIFVNGKPLTISNEKSQTAVNLPYEIENIFNVAFDLLYNTQEEAVHIYSANEDLIWKEFQRYAIPVYAAGGVVKNTNDQYLFIKRNGIWDLPKGHVEKGETFEKAAIREVEEECSITHLKLKSYLDTTYHVYYDQKYYLKVVQWFKMKYTDTSEPKPQTEENIEIVDWFSEKEIPALMQNTFGNIRDLVSKYILK